MLKYIGYRILTLIPVLLGATLLVYSLFWIIPGDVVDIMTGDYAVGDPKAAEVIRAQYGLDKPFYVQYGMWLSKAVRGDLGTSFISGQSVTKEILSRLPVNFQMISVAFGFVFIFGVTAGAISAYRQFSIFDHIMRFLTTLGFSIPNFWAATVVVLLGSLYFRWLPILEYVSFHENPLGNIKCMLLPGFVLGLSTIALIARMTRSTALEVLRQDYVRTARAKGAPEKTVLFVHVLKNAMIPVVTVMGFQVGVMIGGFVLTEQVFVVPGIGSMILEAILERDLVTVVGAIVFLATIFVLINLIVDVLYCFLDPRIRY